MSRKASSLKKAAPASPRSQPSKTQLRLVSQDFGRVPAKAEAPVAGKTLEKDPLEHPMSSHCGLCGNRIEDRAVTEIRTSGRNMTAQTWFYHEVCWKQLERMRRVDHSWDSQQAINPELRYGTSGYGLEGLMQSSETLSWITG